MGAPAAFVLEDDIGMVLLLRALLEETRGWSVHFACGKHKVDVDNCQSRRAKSQACVDKCGGQILDECGVALIDMDVACGSGPRTIRDLRSQYPRLPVVAITAHASAERKARSKGATLCVRKPFSVTDLLGALQEASDVIDLRVFERRRLVAQDV